MNCWKAKVMTMTMPISNQANHGSVKTVSGLEGSETRGPAKAMTPPRVPGPAIAGGDIVRYSGENRRAGVNCQREHLSLESKSEGGFGQGIFPQRKIQFVQRRKECLGHDRIGYWGIYVSRRRHQHGVRLCVSRVRNWVNCWKAKAEAMPISSQANEAVKARALEGSETTETAKAMISARVPSPSLEGEDIVRYSGETRRAGLNSQRNICRFESNTFITDGGAPTAAVGDAVKRPAAITETTPLAAAGGTSQFVAADAGDYLYSIQPVNRYGRGAAITPAGGALTVAASDEVTIGVTPSGTPLPDWYEVFRSQADGTALRRIARVVSVGAGETTITDLNASLPFCTTAYMFQQNLECMSFKQLAPMVKIPLATIDSSVRWMQLLRIIEDLGRTVRSVFEIFEVRPLAA